jgi:hypothetical protein
VRFQLNSELGKINFKDNSSTGYMEGSKISFYYCDDGNDVVFTCMKNGSWSPDPHTYKCQKEDVASSYNNNKKHSQIRCNRYHNLVSRRGFSSHACYYNICRHRSVIN